MKTILSSLRRYITTIFLTAFLLLCFANGFATTYYIDPAGDDLTGAGTAISPWKTLYKATQSVTTSGDTIHVNAGTYTETLQCVLTTGVSIEGDGNISVIKSALTANFAALLIANSPEGTNGNQHISNLKFDGQSLSTYWGIWINGRSNVSVYNCTIEDFKERGIMFSARSDFEDLPPASAYSTGNKFYDNIVSNCAAYNLSTGIYGRGCLNIGGQDGMLIYNNTITQNQRPEGYNGWPIKYMNSGYLKNCKIYNNTLTKIPYGGTYPGETGWDFAIELFHVQGLEIYGNTIQGSIDLSYNTKGAFAYSAWIHHNTMNRAALNSKYESGIIFEYDAESVIVENNFLNNVSCGVSFNTRSGTIISNCVIGKNVFSNLGVGDGIGTAGGILIISEGTNDPVVTNLYIHSNTITAAPGREPWVGIEFASQENGTATAVYIRNNNVTGFVEAWLKGSSITHMNNVAILHNQATANGNNNLPLWPGGDPVDYTYDYKLNDPNAQNGIYFKTNQ